jgi:hypothetical protein
MVATIETTVYTFDELDDDAKEKARDWYRDGFDGETYWAETVVDEAARDIEACGVELDTHRVPLMGGGVRYDPTIYWSLGGYDAGATFTGRVTLAEWMRSQKIAGRYRTLYNAAVGHGVACWIERNDGYGNDTNCHAIRARVEVNDYPDDVAACERLDQQAEIVKDMLTDWAQDRACELHRSLEAEWEYVNADAQVDDAIRANEYTFTENGKRFG